MLGKALWTFCFTGFCLLLSLDSVEPVFQPNVSGRILAGRWDDSIGQITCTNNE